MFSSERELVTVPCRKRPGPDYEKWTTRLVAACTVPSAEQEKRDFR